MKENEPKLHDGMEVLCADGCVMGYVRDIREEDFLVFRPLAPATFVPFSAIQGISDLNVILNVTEDRIAEMNWLDLKPTPMPPSSIE